MLQNPQRNEIEIVRCRQVIFRSVLRILKRQPMTCSMEMPVIEPRDPVFLQQRLDLVTLIVSELGRIV